jgi:hypothetical protein
VYGQYGLVARGKPEEVQCFAGEVGDEALLRRCEAEIPEVASGWVWQFWTGSAGRSGEKGLVKLFEVWIWIVAKKLQGELGGVKYRFF